MCFYWNKQKVKLVFVPCVGVISILLTIFLTFFPRAVFCEEETKTQVKQQQRDPMIPFDMSIFDTAPKKAVVKRSPFKVQGMGRSDKEAYVIIGGKVYREGETKGEITVVKIGGTQVDILVNGSPETLLVKEK